MDFVSRLNDEVKILVMGKPELEVYANSYNNMTSVVVNVNDIDIYAGELDVKLTPGNLIKDIFTIEYSDITEDYKIEEDKLDRLIDFIAHYMCLVDLIIFSGSGRKGYNNSIAKAVEDFFEIESASKSLEGDLSNNCVDRNLYNQANCRVYESVLLGLNG